ncbi:hypothetical protein V6N11_019191 [Hibiscus sabdariffa]|uniref:Uncharacterized protein n=1 Tax=Hibiscus sabdariffa TaxID=183260 RepID=A0ABR2R241_9ROSI
MKIGFFPSSPFYSPKSKSSQNEALATQARAAVTTVDVAAGPALQGHHVKSIGLLSPFPLSDSRKRPSNGRENSPRNRRGGKSPPPSLQ